MRRPGEARAVEDIDKVRVLRTDEVAEERDLVGVYLHEISRTPLLDAAQEVDLSRAIEAAVGPEHPVDQGDVPAGVGESERQGPGREGGGATGPFLRANLRAAPVSAPP